MRSGEVARLAGVTVRTLRHYHRVGVLAEPERRSNDYRKYDVHDVIRILRIRRLSSLGIPLGRMPELLDGPADDAEDLLEELDGELAEQIDRLTRQRDLIARLRAHGGAADLPPELAPFLAVLAGAGLSPKLAAIDRDQSVLLAHLVGEAGMPDLERFYERVTDPDLVPTVTTLAERFHQLGSHAPEQDVSELVESLLATYTTVIEEFAAARPPVDLGRATDIVSRYLSEVLNPSQRTALERLAARLDA